jgi:hypothetical protein
MRSPVAQLMLSSDLPPRMPDEDMFESEDLPQVSYPTLVALPPAAAPASEALPQDLFSRLTAATEAPPRPNLPGAPGFVERRSGIDRRQAMPSRGSFAAPDRRSAHPFGRRSTDRPPEVATDHAAEKA